MKSDNDEFNELLISGGLDSKRLSIEGIKDENDGSYSIKLRASKDIYESIIHGNVDYAMCRIDDILTFDEPSNYLLTKTEEGVTYSSLLLMSIMLTFALEKIDKIIEENNI